MEKQKKAKMVIAVPIGALFTVACGVLPYIGFLPMPENREGFDGGLLMFRVLVPVCSLLVIFCLSQLDTNRGWRVDMMKRGNIKREKACLAHLGRAVLIVGAVYLILFVIAFDLNFWFGPKAHYWRFSWHAKTMIVLAVSYALEYAIWRIGAISWLKNHCSHQYVLIDTSTGRQSFFDDSGTSETAYDVTWSKYRCEICGKEKIVEEERTQVGEVIYHDPSYWS